MLNPKRGWKATSEDLLLNRNTGTFAWILHRITGLMLIGYLLLHIFVLSSIMNGEATFDQSLGFVQSGLFHYLEIGLIAVIFIHLINGLNVTIADFFKLTKIQKTLFWIGTVLFLCVLGYTFYVFL